MRRARPGRLIVVTGGGSGGHVYPALEVIRALYDLDPTLRFAYIGQRGGVERQIVRAAELPTEVPFYGIAAEKLRRYWDWRSLAIPFAVIGGTVESMQQLLRLRPSAVLCKGGYVGVPVAIAAWLLRIPIVLHETDAAMGLANRLIAPFAARIAVSFGREHIPKGIDRTKLVYTGQPVGRVYYQVKKPERTGSRPKLFITGGTYGSERLNTLTLEILPQLLERYEVTHQTGVADFVRVQAASSHRHYHPMATVETAKEMASLLAAADLVVSRAGGTLFELAVLQKPAILIPLPSAGSDHQRVNASILAAKGAVVMLDEATLTSAQLLQEISALIRDSARRAALATNIAQFARPDAAAQVARLVLEVARQ